MAKDDGQSVNIEDAIRSELGSITEQLTGFEALVKRRAALEAMLAIANGEVVVAPQRSATRGRGPTTSQIDEHRIIDVVGANQPVGASDIGKAVGASGNALSMKLKAMVEDGKLSKEGERRATKYSLKVG